MKMKTLAIASVSMLASIAASARTVAWYSMEGVVGERPLPADVVENRAAPGTLQLIPGHPNGTRCPVYTNGFPAAWHVYDPVSGQSYSNGAAFACNYEGSTRGNGSFAHVENDEALHLSTFTVEFFVRVPRAYDGGWNVLAVMPASRKSNCVNADAWGIRLTSEYQIRARFSPEQEVSGSTVSGNVELIADRLNNVSNLYDGRWHHVALTFDGETKTATLYYDYTSRGSKTLTFPIWYESEEECRLCIGGTIQTTGDAWCDIDEFRISDTVLTSSQFLRIRSSNTSLLRDDTVICYTFDDSPDFLAGYCDSNIVYNAADAATFKGTIVSKEYNDGRTISYSAEVPAATLYSGIESSSGGSNPRSLYNCPGDAAGGSYVSIPDSSDVFRTGSFTLECFFKADGSTTTLWTPLVRRNGGGNVQANLGFGSTSGLLSATCKESGGQQVSFTDISGSTCADSAWHHAALVVDRDMRRMSLYLDYELVRAKPMSDDELVASSSNPILIGGTDGVTFKGWIDTVRVSSSALKPSEFLTGYHFSDRVLARARFEESGNFGSDVSPLAFASGAVTGTVEVDPSAAASPKVFDGVNDRRGLANAAGASLVNGKLTYANNPLIPIFASDGITYEFFVKASPQGKDAYSGLLRSTTESDNFFSMVSDPYVGSGLQMRFVTYDPLSSSEQLWQTKCEMSITRRDIVVFDNKWHHFAFGVVPDGTNTTVSVYLDNSCVLSTNLVGLMHHPRNKGNLIVGGIAGSGQTLVGGMVDELRVSRGAPNPELFLRRKSALPNGFLLVVQ